MARKSVKATGPTESSGPDKIIAIRCTAEYRRRVDQAAKKEFRDSSGLIALALQEYFEKRGYEPLPSRLGDEA
jgi:hypothetical protein